MNIKQIDFVTGKGDVIVAFKVGDFVFVGTPEMKQQTLQFACDYYYQNSQNKSERSNKLYQQLIKDSVDKLRRH